MFCHRKASVGYLLAILLGIGDTGSFADVIVVPVVHSGTLPPGIGSGGGRERTFIVGFEILLNPDQYFPPFGDVGCLSCPAPYLDLIDFPEELIDQIIVPPNFEMSVEKDPTPTPTLDDPDAVNLRLTYFGDAILGPAELGAVKFGGLAMPPEMTSLRFAGYGYDKELKEMLPNVGVAKFANNIGDYNDNGLLDLDDIQKLANVVRHPHLLQNSTLARFDLNQDNLVTQDDLRSWIEDLRQSYVGDANVDGKFNSQDILAVFQAGEYDDDLLGNSTWSTGDWTGNGEFDSADLIAAFQSGGYERNLSRVAVVPEPSAFGLALLTVAALPFNRRARRR